jgi:receptor expression-enhancing protein 5/6
MLEYFLNALLYWVPYWFLIKTIFFLWLALPQFRVGDITIRNDIGYFTKLVLTLFRRAPKYCMVNTIEP